MGKLELFNLLANGKVSYLPLPNGRVVFGIVVGITRENGSSGKCDSWIVKVWREGCQQLDEIFIRTVD